MHIEVRLNADDLKALEDTLSRALTRGIVSAMRMLAREGNTALNGVIHVPKAEEVAPEPPAPLAPEPPAPPPPAAAPAVKTRQPRRSVAEVVRTVAHRPDGFIPTDRACELIGLPKEQASVILRTWIFEKTIHAVIVAEHHGKPSKGLPGRLHVHSASVRERNSVRLKNLALPGALRKTPKALAPLPLELN